ncbi:MAG TPA: outer membrane beta-barrel protein [Polyangiaceae bacterium]|nr:outer membrane beta-barrel protein [Polyangiaceae bacterium]
MRLFAATLERQSVALLAAALCLAASSAHAFERQWHLGAGAGVSNGEGLEMSPAVGVYAAYGLSDVFDARLELTARGYGLASELNPHQLSAMLGLVYKLDVLRWVPWGGVYVGYQGFEAAPRQELPFKQHDAALGIGLGLDYAFSRSFGAGVTLRFDDALSDAKDANFDATFDALLRAEYRWGW